MKQVDPGEQRSMGVEVHPGGRVVISTFSLKSLIAAAFGLTYGQVSSGEACMEKEQYDVEGIPPGNLRLSITNLKHTVFGIDDERLREMLQTLLVQRFQLKFHREAKPGVVYELKRSGKKLGLRQADLVPDADTNPTRGGDSFGSVGYAGGSWVIAATTMPQLAKFAADFILHAPVLDRTALTGSFDYRQRSTDTEPDYRNNSESFLRLLPDLGLKLERSRGPVEIFVVESAARPSSN